MFRQESGERTGQRGKIPNLFPLWTPLIQTAKRRPPLLENPAKQDTPRVLQRLPSADAASAIRRPFPRRGTHLSDGPNMQAEARHVWLPEFMQRCPPASKTSPAKGRGTSEAGGGVRPMPAPARSALFHFHLCSSAVAADPGGHSAMRFLHGVMAAQLRDHYGH